MRLIRPILPALAALALGCAARSADGPYASVTAAAVWQDNVTNATAGDGVLGAFSLGSTGDLTWLTAVDFSTMLSTGLAADVDLCPNFSGLDSLMVGPRVGLRHKFGLGPYAPVAFLGLEADGHAFRDAARSNADGALVAEVSQRLNEAVQVVVDARLCTYAANHAVYSGNYTHLGAKLNWDLNETWRVSATGGWRDGDVVAEYAAARTPFGWGPIDTGAYHYTGDAELVQTFSEPFIAYRTKAPTWSGAAAVSPAIGRHTSLALQYTRMRTTAYDTYVDNVYSLSIVHHF
jgi:hypothetical protein